MGHLPTKRYPPLLIRGVNSSRLREILVKAQNKQIVDNSKLRHLLKGKVKHEEEKNH